MLADIDPACEATVAELGARFMSVDLGAPDSIAALAEEVTGTIAFHMPEPALTLTGQVLPVNNGFVFA